MEKLLVMDVAKITITDLETKKVTATATATMSSINSSLSEEQIRAGWGGGIVATINSEKNVELSFTDVFFSMDYLAMVQGSEVEEGATGTVIEQFEGTITDNGGVLEIAVPADVTVTSATLVDKDGTQDAVTITSGKITAPEGLVAEAGDSVIVFYTKEIVGQKVVIDAQKFPKFVGIQYHTRAFNPDTNVVTKDIYIQFDKVKPQGNMDLALEVSSAANTEMTFVAMNKNLNSTEMGRYFAVDRA